MVRFSWGGMFDVVLAGGAPSVLLCSLRTNTNVPAELLFGEAQFLVVLKNDSLNGEDVPSFLNKAV